MKKLNYLAGIVGFCTLIITSFSLTENNHAETTMAPNLTGVYEGTNGSRSLYYVTQEDSKVYFFAETYDATWALAFEGSIKGSQLWGNWYHLTKGAKKKHGKATFTVSNDGRTWTLDSETGGYPNNSIKKTTLPSKIPATRNAAFSGNSLGDISGLYHADEALRIHLRDVNNKIVFYAESKRTLDNNNRPGMSSVFFGQKSRNSFTGKWVDLPLGFTSNEGKVTYKIVGPKYFQFKSGYFPGINYRRK